MYYKINKHSFKKKIAKNRFFFNDRQTCPLKPEASYLKFSKYQFPRNYRKASNMKQVYKSV